MTVRAIGPLLCGGLLIFAVTAGAFAQVNTTTPLPSANTSAVTTKNRTLPAPVVKVENGVKSAKDKTACRSHGGKQMTDCNTTMRVVSTTR